MLSAPSVVSDAQQFDLIDNMFPFCQGFHFVFNICFRFKKEELLFDSVQKISNAERSA